MKTFLNELGVVCALGRGKTDVSRALFAADRSGLVVQDGWVPDRALPLGAVAGDMPSLPDGLAQHEHRNNRLLMLAAREIEPALRAAVGRFGRDRVGVVLGTSTAGIEEATTARAHQRTSGHWPDSYRYAHQELGAPAACLADWLQLEGPAYGISTACTSGARALMSAQRLLRMGLCDAVICGGVDSLARFPMNGFSALEAIDAAPCRPFATDRAGINIGEAAALFLMTRDPGPVQLLGAGASSDAYHMSSPDPEGAGAQRAMLAALDAAGLQAHAIDYVNLHGTATVLNDRMESRAVDAVFGGDVPCASTKALTGHTLAAAGALEAAFCWLSLTDADAGGRRLPPQADVGDIDPALPALRFARVGDTLAAGGPRRLLSNAFAFGGNNACLILGDPD